MKDLKNKAIDISSIDKAEYQELVDEIEEMAYLIPTFDYEKVKKSSYIYIRCHNDLRACCFDNKTDNEKIIYPSDVLESKNSIIDLI